MSMPLTVRFWAKVDRRGDDECWPWLGCTKAGYGAFWVNEKRRAAIAHRFAYELLVGPIPDGLTLDHLCRNRACVNPAHLDPCTAGENARRSPDAPYNVKARQTHCRRGHEFDERNTAIHNGRRECRACMAIRRRVHTGDNSAAARLEALLTRALERLDKFGYPQLRGLEETSAGSCYTIDPDARVIA